MHDADAKMVPSEDSPSTMGNNIPDELLGRISVCHFMS